jgi:hypothetical protein
VDLVHPCQQSDVGSRVTLHETAPPVCLQLYRITPQKHADQSRRLRPAERCHFLHVPPHQASTAPLQSLIALLPQRLIHPDVNLLPFPPLESQREWARPRLDIKKEHKNVSGLGPVNSLLRRNNEWRGLGKEAPDGSARRITRGNRG